VDGTQNIFDDTPEVDRDAVRGHVAMIHKLAAGSPGKLIIASYSDDTPPMHEHFAIGSVDAMTDAIVEIAKTRNVYTPLAIARPDLPPSTRGKTVDYIGVVGVVMDFDGPDATEWEKLLQVHPDYVLETSAKRVQCFYFSGELVPIGKADELIRRLKLAAKSADKTADPIHVWRIPGTLNHPTAKKLGAGRSSTPQLVKVIYHESVRTTRRATPAPPCRGAGIGRGEEFRGL
jgi:hypothetical protein